MSERPCTCHPDDAPTPCAKGYALNECLKRVPPKPIHYPDAGLTLELAMFSGYFNNKTAYAPKFKPFPSGITADQAREAAHLLNQLAEYLEWQEKQP